MHSLAVLRGLFASLLTAPDACIHSLSRWTLCPQNTPRNVLKDAVTAAAGVVPPVGPGSQPLKCVASRRRGGGCRDSVPRTFGSGTPRRHPTAGEHVSCRSPCMESLTDQSPTSPKSVEHRVLDVRTAPPTIRAPLSSNSYLNELPLWAMDAVAGHVSLVEFYRITGSAYLDDPCEWPIPFSSACSGTQSSRELGYSDCFVYIA
jgi:hypothetical protein